MNRVFFASKINFFCMRDDVRRHAIPSLGMYLISPPKHATTTCTQAPDLRQVVHKRKGWTPRARYERCHARLAHNHTYMFTAHSTQLTHSLPYYNSLIHPPIHPTVASTLTRPPRATRASTCFSADTACLSLRKIPRPLTRTSPSPLVTLILTRHVHWP